MIELTEHQKQVKRDVLNTLSTKKKALLSGMSGTGKSTTTEAIIREYRARGKSVWITATTHKAVEVISSMAGMSRDRVSTIHSFLNMQPDTSQQHRPMVVNLSKMPNRADLLIIDEFSMLTTDVIDALKMKMAGDNYMHVLFVGDASQLILNHGDIDQLHLEDVTEYLTEPMRQEAISDIAMYSKMASSFILGRGPEPAIPWGEEIIKYTDHKEFVDAWKQSKIKDKRILAFKNSVVKSYNNNIAKNYRNQASEYEVGNMVTLRDTVKTSDGGFIPNRKTLEILSIKDEGDYYDIGSEYGKFRVNKTKTWLDSLTNKYKLDKNWSMFYSVREKYTQVHHADAMTTHSAQGDTFEEVFIDATDMMSAPKDVLRMAYVAISRAKTKVHIFVGTDGRDYSKFKQSMDDLVEMF